MVVFVVAVVVVLRFACMCSNNVCQHNCCCCFGNNRNLCKWSPGIALTICHMSLSTANPLANTIDRYADRFLLSAHVLNSSSFDLKTWLQSWTFVQRLFIACLWLLTNVRLDRLFNCCVCCCCCCSWLIVKLLKWVQKLVRLSRRVNHFIYLCWPKSFE